MSNIPIQNAPENLTMTDGMAYQAAYGGLAKSARYAVRVIPVGSMLVNLKYNDFLRQFTYLSDSAELPGRAFMNIDIRYYGPNFKVPFQTQYEDMTISFLCRNQSYERQFFDDWMEIINPTNLWDFNYRDDYRSTIEIFQLADYGEVTEGSSTRIGGAKNAPTAGQAMYKWTVHDAYPMIVNPQPVTWADDNFHRLSVSFTYTKWNRVGRDATPGSFRTASDFIRGSTSLNLPK